MHRRTFLRATALAAAATAVGTKTTAAMSEPHLSRRMKHFALEEHTIPELQELMNRGRESSVSITRKYLGRIDQIDRRGPTLKAVIELNPDALAIAREADAERKQKGPRGPLHGIPVLIKDNIATHDRMTTTAGSLALAGSVPPRDSFVAEKLRAAGAVLLGKTNLSEWANFRGFHSSSGWSARGGQTRNPYVLDRNPSGSSSGSGVAVSANLCSVAVGTETDGSILSPSSYNGIVGIKPTLGLISRSGIVPIAHSQDTAGPMARTVTDAAILLGVLAGTDSGDSATADCDSKRKPDYSAFLDASALRGARIGVARAFFGAHRRVDELMERALVSLKRLGAVLVDPVDLKRNSDMDAAEIEVLRYEMKADMNAYLAGLGSAAPVHTLQEIIDFNDQHRDTELRWFGQEELIKSQAKGPLTDAAYQEALAKCRKLARAEGIDAVLSKDNLDAIIAPTSTPAHVTDWLLGDHGLGDSTTPAAVAGYPSITVPAGFVEALPVGLSFFGAAWSEPKLISLAFAFEHGTRERRPPTFLPTLS
jgi:amidase